MKAIKFLFTGIFFGIVLTKSEAVSWYRIVEMFRFESFHMYGIIGSAVITGIVLLQLSKRFKMNTTEGNPIALPEKAKQYKKALFGGSIFGQVILFYHFVEVFLQGTADNDKPRGQVSHSKTSSSNEDLFLYLGCR